MHLERNNRFHTEDTGRAYQTSLKTHWFCYRYSFPHSLEEKFSKLFFFLKKSIYLQGRFTGERLSDVDIQVGSLRDLESESTVFDSL